MIEVRCNDPNVTLGVVVARGCRSPSVDAVVQQALQRFAPPSDERKKAVRDLLRHGKYKPTGRGKPASEYLAQAAAESAFPRVLPLVDCCNIVSLQSGLPISLIDLQRAAVTQFLVRRGRAGEEYVFNAGGQTIALEDLLLTALMPQDVPCANAVKDSMATKLQAEATDVLAVIYAPRALAVEAKRSSDALCSLYGDLCAATEVKGELVNG